MAFNKVCSTFLIAISVWGMLVFVYPHRLQAAAVALEPEDGVLVSPALTLNDANASQQRGVVFAAAANVPQIFEHFNPPWNGTNSPDGLWRIANGWRGTGNNLFRLANAPVTANYDGQAGGYLQLIVSADPSLIGGEIQTIGAQGSNLLYGYYEVRMKVSEVPGECVSFFWKEVDYGPGEIDIEFLTNEAWITSAASGQVHYTIHPNWSANGTVHTQNLSFNPAKGFHCYGFLWTPTQLDYTVDGQIVKTFTNPPAANLVNTQGGYIMMNAWTGAANWGGGPPAATSTSIYDWVKYYPNATTVPAY